MIDAPASDGRFLESVRLFNEGEYFESHEVLEGLWIETPADASFRNFYKGFIQCAAALFLLRRGTMSGARALCATSIQYLEAYAPSCLDLDVTRLVQDMRRCFDADAESRRYPQAHLSARVKGTSKEG